MSNLETPIEISIIIPCLNEAENAEAIATAVLSELSGITSDFEILFIDNGSTDGTIEIIKRLCADNSRIRLIVNNRNYGQMRSPTYGIFQTRGQAVIGLSADFQDPPALIGEFIKRWRSGTPIVLGVRESEAGSPFLNFIRTVGYSFYARFGDYPVIPRATGFGLYDREVVDALKLWRDPEPFFRGMLVESGFEIQTIPYAQPPRAHGVSKNNFLSLLSFALSGLASSSRNLLRIPLIASLFGIILALILFLTAAVLRLSGLRISDLFLIISTALLGFSVTWFFIGLIGEQIRIIALTVRRVPLVIEKERVNF